MPDSHRPTGQFKKKRRASGDLCGGPERPHFSISTSWPRQNAVLLSTLARFGKCCHRIGCASEVKTSIGRKVAYDCYAIRLVVMKKKCWICDRKRSYVRISAHRTTNRPSASNWTSRIQQLPSHALKAVSSSCMSTPMMLLSPLCEPLRVRCSEWKACL